MRTVEQFADRIAAYGPVEWIHDPNVGNIAWHLGTGDNVEMLFIEAKEVRKGHGTELYRRMCLRLIEEGKRPYHSVYGHRLGSNEAARAFYDSLGFTQLNIGRSIYGGDDCVVMWVEWKQLLRRLGIEVEV